MIEFDEVNLKYPNGVKALEDVNLFIDRGEFVFLTGPTGSGKSSLLKLIYRQEVPTSGEVYVNNHDITDLLPSRIPLLRRRIGVVFQDFKLLDYKNVFENTAYALEVTSYDPEKIPPRVETVLKVVGMLDKKDRYPDQLSGGEKQLTSIARALAHNPPVLLADEPTGNLDAESALNVIKILEYISTRGTTVVVATHDLSLVKYFKKRVVAIKNGKIVSDEGSTLSPVKLHELLETETQKA